MPEVYLENKIEIADNKYKEGKQLFTNKSTDEIRREYCLCLNCSIMNDCEVASKLFEISKDYNIALMITRCGYEKNGKLQYTRK